MAFMIPETLPEGGGLVMAGERRVFAALRDHLPEDYVVYYDVPVDGRYPDFIVIGADLGVVILEVKDWRLAAVEEITGEGVRLRHGDATAVVRNPVQQARGYARRLVDRLRERPALRRGEHLRCGWGFGLVLPRLTAADTRQRSLFGASLAEAFGPELVLTADDLVPARLLTRLRALIPDWIPRLDPLTPEEIDEIRGVIHPEIRVGWGPADDRIAVVMDRHQERLARSLGDGHRILRGVAGSGKTLLLVCRARYLLERHRDWRVLVVCFNKVLASHLQAAAVGPDPRVEVRTFHSWCRRQLTAAGLSVPEPPEKDRAAWEEYWERRVPRLLLDAYESGHAAQGRYQAILVDEGQDFCDDWYRCLLQPRRGL